MVQPTRIVCCAWDGFMPARTEANAPAAAIHFEAIRIVPTPLFGADRRQRQMMWAKHFMVQMIRQAAPVAARPRLRSMTANRRLVGQASPLRRHALGAALRQCKYCKRRIGCARGG